MKDIKLIDSIRRQDQSTLEKTNRQLEDFSAVERIQWAFENLPENHVLSSSFGIQSAVMLHMLTSLRPDIPIILVDTGYLFEETYLFIDELTQRFDLNLHIYRSTISPAWQESRYGKLWQQGLEGIEYYNRLNKVEPFNQALNDLNVDCWFAGLRRQQSGSRHDLSVLTQRDECFKIHPIIDWSNQDIHRYLTGNNLPYHPLWDTGYMSVGDHHTSQPQKADSSEEQTRFFGLKRECGLHE
ncbi:MAG: phosphoadenylyl-sulfate reductase [Gammaproteobacteria bacterium]|nr:phosphoadenylyl-sulfate reductase [Gammaproteobacteria bacterium]